MRVAVCEPLSRSDALGGTRPPGALLRHCVPPSRDGLFVGAGGGRGDFDIARSMNLFSTEGAIHF
jgi:hypothetical protein